MRDGYKYIYAPTHPNATKAGYVCEHRLVMEKKLGRYLTKKEVVHHRDENKLNNREDNLRLSKSTGRHFVDCHMAGRNKKGQFKGVMA